ncbi:hypothetical protein BaRGS_00004988, partial [Batillaria attramentaria]
RLRRVGRSELLYDLQARTCFEVIRGGYCRTSTRSSRACARVFYCWAPTKCLHLGSGTKEIWEASYRLRASSHAEGPALPNCSAQMEFAGRIMLIVDTHPGQAAAAGGS